MFKKARSPLPIRRSWLRGPTPWRNEAQVPLEFKQLGVTVVWGCDHRLEFQDEVLGKPADADEVIAAW